MYVAAQHELSQTDAARSVMEEGAAAAGLSWPPAPFPEVGTLRERLAASPFLMAPMASVTDAAYRMVMRAGGAALAYTEMVSVTGIHYASDKTWSLVEPNAGEPDLAVQLFGAEPEHFREAAAQLGEHVGSKLALVDVNMACPVPKVTKGGAGSAPLMTPRSRRTSSRPFARSSTFPSRSRFAWAAGPTRSWESTLPAPWRPRAPPPLRYTDAWPPRCIAASRARRAWPRWCAR